jgi:hypothetical protein
MTFDIHKDWKEFNISVPALKVAVEAIDSEKFVGISSDVNLRFHFSEEPTGQVKDDIDALWDAIDAQHEIATSYVSKEDIAADEAAKKASGMAKLIALGLTEAEATALVG